MTREAIEQKVREKLDEVSQFDAYQIDTVEFIDKFMDEAADKILMNVPLHLIPPHSFYSQNHNPSNDGTGRIQLPDDYLRLSSFQMVEWDRPVSHPISQEHPLYNLQKNTVTRGKPSKPVCVVGYFLDPGDSSSESGETGTYVKALEYYSVVSDYTIEHALYVRDVEAGEDFPEKLVDVLSWQTAADILQVVGSEKASAYCNAQVQKFIQDNTLKL
jgi:hypothetical protein